MVEWLEKKQYFLFDMDGTIVDLEELNFSSFRETIAKLLNQELLYSEYLTYMAGSGSKAGFSRYFQSKSIVGKDVSEFVKHYREAKNASLQNNFESVVSVKPGVIDFLVALQNAKKKIAVGTSTGRFFADPILERSGLKKFFEVIVTVNDVQNTKPAPDIFFAALEQLGGKEKREAVIFEDSPNGILAARNSEIDYVVIHTKGQNDSAVIGEPHVISDYRELL